jgi:hypothetical protein
MTEKELFERLVSLRKEITEFPECGEKVQALGLIAVAFSVSYTAAVLEKSSLDWLWLRKDKS